jgi:hypothetical protein
VGLLANDATGGQPSTTAPSNVDLETHRTTAAVASLDAAHLEAGK